MNTQKTRSHFKANHRQLYLYGALSIALVLTLAVVLIRGVQAYYAKNTVHRLKSYPVEQSAMVQDDQTFFYEGDLTLRGQAVANGTAVEVVAYHLSQYQAQQIVYAELRYQDQIFFTEAKHLKLTQTNAVNQYIVDDLQLPRTEFLTDINPKFKKEPYATANQQPQGVIVHDTGTEYSMLDEEIAFMNWYHDLYGSFVHTFIDGERVVRVADEAYLSEGAGLYVNPYYVQFEMPHEYTKEGFARQTAYAAYYTASILRRYELEVTEAQPDKSGTVWTHEMISLTWGGTDHVDPVDYWHRSATALFGTTYTLTDFVQLVQAYYNQIEID